MPASSGSSISALKSLTQNTSPDGKTIKYVQYNEDENVETKKKMTRLNISIRLELSATMPF